MGCLMSPDEQDAVWDIYQEPPAEAPVSSRSEHFIDVDAEENMRD